jgi:AraC family transcriptional regulator
MDAISSRRTSNGLTVSIVAAPVGITHAPASRDHYLGIHLGRPVRATCRFDGRTQRRLQSRGDMDLVPAGLPGSWEDDRSARILRIRVSPKLLAATAESMGVHGDRVDLVPQHQLRDPQLEHIAWAFEAELQSPDMGEWLYGESLATALAARLVKRYASSARIAATSSRGLSRRQLGHVVEYVEANLDRTLTLAELAQIAGASPSHFKTLFKRSTEMPVHQYVVKRRVERARMLLEQGAVPAVAAHESGFADQSHMARWMRRLLGLTPRVVSSRAR